MADKDKKSKIMSFLAGAGQGVSYNLGDETYAAGLAAKDYLSNPDMSLEQVKNNYKTYRDKARVELKDIQAQEPIAYGAGDITGSLLSPSPFGKVNALGKAALSSGLSGLGASEAENNSGMLADAARSASIGTVMAGMGDLIKFPKKSKIPTKDIASEIKKTGEVVQLPIDNKLLNIKNLREQLSDKDKKIINSIEEKGSSEPYVGSSIGGEVARGNGIEAIGNTKQMPITNFKPNGIIGSNVPSGGADPFAWVDLKLGAGKKALEAHKNKNLSINTRSDLISHDEYVELLQPGKHEVNFFIPNIVANQRSLVSPASANLNRIINAAKKLKENGIDSTINLENLPIKENLKISNDINLLSELKKLGIKMKTVTNEISPESEQNFKNIFGDDYMQRIKE